MLYAVKVNGETPPWSPIESEPEPFTRPDGTPGVRPGAMLAVDKAREALEFVALPEGGTFELEVSCAESWTDSAGRPHAPGVVSAFSVQLEPAPEHRAAWEAKLKAEEAAAARAALKAELLEELRAEGKIQ